MAHCIHIKWFTTKKLILFVLAYFCSNLLIIGQNINQAILLSFEGKGVVTRNQTQMELKIPFLFVAEDVIKVSEGVAKLLLSDGNEVQINKGQTFQVSKLTGKNQLALEEFSKQAKKDPSYNLRGEEHTLLPVKSNLSNATKLQINWRQADSTTLATFTIYKSGTDEMIWQRKNIATSSTKVDKVLPPGNYYWTLEGSSGSFTEIGEFMISNSSLCNYSETPNTGHEMLELINCLIKNEYFFEAITLLNKGIKSYGRNSVFFFKLQELTQNLSNK